MDSIYEWVRSIVFYMILVTMIFRLLPDKKYEKYLRLFSGMVFILLIFGPLSDLTGLEARLTGAFEKITFQNDVKFLKQELDFAEAKRLERLFDGYREAVEADIRVMAEGISVECLELHADLDMEAESETFGNLLTVDMTVGLLEQESSLPQELIREKRREVNREIEGLKKRIGEYYGVEERNIAVNLKSE